MLSELALLKNWLDLLTGHCVEQTEHLKPFPYQLIVGLGCDEVALIAEVPKGSGFVLAIVGSLEERTTVLSVKGHEDLRLLSVPIVDLSSGCFGDVEHPL